MVILVLNLSMGWFHLTGTENESRRSDRAVIKNERSILCASEVKGLHVVFGLWSLVFGLCCGL